MARSMQKAMNRTRSFPLLRDYGQYPGYAHAYHDNGKRIFCGGNSQRDWKSCLLLAEALPDWQFVLVGMRGEPPVAVPDNVKVLPGCCSFQPVYAYIMWVDDSVCSGEVELSGRTYRADGGGMARKGSGSQ